MVYFYYYYKYSYSYSYYDDYSFFIYLLTYEFINLSVEQIKNGKKNQTNLYSKHIMYVILIKIIVQKNG